MLIGYDEEAKTSNHECNHHFYDVLIQFVISTYKYVLGNIQQFVSLVAIFYMLRFVLPF